MTAPILSIAPAYRLPIAKVKKAAAAATTTELVTFAELAAQLSDVVKGRKDGAGWLPVTMSPVARRHHDNIDAVNFLVIDAEADTEKVRDESGKVLIDEFGDELKRVVGIDPPSVQDISEQLKKNGLRSIIHTSYSHSAQHPRYRIVVALSRQMKPQELKPVGEWLVKQLGIVGCYDRGALEPARLYYLPRCPSDERLALFESALIEGEPLNVAAVFDEINSDALLLLPEPTTQPPPAPAHVANTYTPADYQAHDASLLSDLRSALNAIRPDERDTWIAVGQRLKTLGEDGRRLWLEWSQGSIKWQPTDARLWDGFTADRTSYKAIFAQAQALGWVNPASAPQRLDPAQMFGSVAGDEQHPLTKTIDLTAEVLPPKWILPQFIAEGIVLIAGGHGVGKTTALLPLAMAAGGLHENDYPLAPAHWRHVVYITEDVSQAKLIINGWMNEAGLNHADLVERVHLVEALRDHPMSVVRVGQHYKENYTRTINTTTGVVELPPLVVIDTMAATFALENENDNAEASTLIAALKQRFRLPLWIVGHVSKGDLSKDGLKGNNPSLRGASAFEADANQVLYLTKEADDSRWLVRGKSRFESKWHELLIETSSRSYQVQNQFGDFETLTQRWGIARPQEKSRKELAAEQHSEQLKQIRDDRKKVLLDCINRADVAGEPLNRTGVQGAIGGQKQRNTDLINELLQDKWIYEVSVPVAVRLSPSKSNYLIGLSMGERAEYIATGKPPAQRLQVHESWRKV